MELRKETVKQIRGLIVFTALLIVCLWKYDVVMDAFRFVLNILYPFLLGGAIAFVLSVPMNFVERKLFTERKLPEKYKRKYARGISLLIVLSGVIGLLAIIMFGLIPEFIGRVPVVVSLDALDEDALVRILQEPKNSLVKQYKALMDMDGVDLECEEPAISAIAKLAVERETGARGLRTIVEDIMLDIMYEIPSDSTIEKVVVTEGCVKKRTRPLISYHAAAAAGNEILPEENAG